MRRSGQAPLPNGEERGAEGRGSVDHQDNRAVAISFCNLAGLLNTRSQRTPTYVPCFMVEPPPGQPVYTECLVWENRIPSWDLRDFLFINLSGVRGVIAFQPAVPHDRRIAPRQAKGAVVVLIQLRQSRPYGPVCPTMWKPGSSQRSPGSCSLWLSLPLDA